MHMLSLDALIRLLKLVLAVCHGSWFGIVRRGAPTTFHKGSDREQKRGYLKRQRNPSWVSCDQLKTWYYDK